MKRKVAIVFTLCLIITKLAVVKNNSYNKQRQQNDSLEINRDSLLFRQTRSLDLLYEEAFMLDSIYNECKISNSLKQEEIQQVDELSTKIVNLQRTPLKQKK